MTQVETENLRLIERVELLEAQAENLFATVKSLQDRLNDVDKKASYAYNFGKPLA